jgi:phosphatidate phosphatase APP1
MDDGNIRSGMLHLIANHGYSVISDIDDTVRASQVLQKMNALRRLFYEPQEPISGMPELYKHLATSLTLRDQGGEHPTAFHYLSASPFELSPMLNHFLKKANFPRATILPSPVRLRNVIKALGMDLRQYKREGTMGIMTRFPQRRFILSGDSGQLDPEAYGDVVRMSPHGKQVSCILIRLVVGQNSKVEAVKNTKARFAVAFQGIPETKWRVYEDPKALLNTKFSQDSCYNPGERNQWVAPMPQTPPPGSVFGMVDGGEQCILRQMDDGTPAVMRPVGMQGTAMEGGPAPVPVFTLDPELDQQVLPF